MARINRVTDEPATSQVAYCLSATLTMSTTKNANFTTFPVVLLTGLLPETLYFYQIYVEDIHGNLAVSDVSNFSTLAVEDVTSVFLQYVSHTVQTISLIQQSRKKTRAPGP